jgi:hexosaminidase
MGKHWNETPRVVRFKREKGFTTNEALQAHFNERLSHLLERLGRRMVGWDEILHPGLPKGTVIQSWRGTEYLGRAARQGISGILSAPYYLDHMKTADAYYLADPLPPNHGLRPEEAARVLGGEACMWAEHVNPETVDSRLWPRLAALAERFWSPATVRDVPDLYRRLAPVSVQLERLGLGHEAHSARMLRRLTGQLEVPALQDLLAYTMPVSFGERGRLQRTTQHTPFTRLVDAARPDPWSRSRMLVLATAVAAGPRKAPNEIAELRAIFTRWTRLADQVVALRGTVPLAADGEPAARALGDLGLLGLEALHYLTGDGAPAQWKAAARTTLDSLDKPQGLLRLAGVEAVRLLVDAT